MLGSRNADDVAAANPELRQLLDEHRALDGKIDQYAQRPYLTSLEEIEVKTLKREKLLRKDRIEAILSRYR